MVVFRTTIQMYKLQTSIGYLKTFNNRQISATEGKLLRPQKIKYNDIQISIQCRIGTFKT